MTFTPVALLLVMPPVFVSEPMPWVRV